MARSFLGLVLAASVVLAWAHETSLLFSAHKPGEAIKAPFRIISLPKVTPNQFEFVNDGDRAVLKSVSAASASSVGIPLVAPAASQREISWQWKVSNVVAAADMNQKSGDDFAARLYVFFDVPMESLGFFERTKIRLARMFFSADVPTAAICYVWDNMQPVGYSRFSPYTSRVRIIVLQSGGANAGKWVSESRDVAADFRQAFGTAAPAITGVAVGNDTDQTRQAVVAWFGDIAFGEATR
jgi:hypothetical protein